jgi:hypothetical protein
LKWTGGYLTAQDFCRPYLEMCVFEEPLHVRLKADCFLSDKHKLPFRCRMWRDLIEETDNLPEPFSNH